MLRTQVTPSVVPPGQLCVSVGTSPSLSYYISPPAVFVPLQSFLSIFRVCPLLCLRLYLIFRFAFLLFSFFAVYFFYFLLCFVFLSFCCLFCLTFASLMFSDGVRMFPLLFLSLFYTLRIACEPVQHAKICAFSCVLPFSISCSLLLPCLN